MAVKLDDSHQELSNAIVVAQATSNQMSKRDTLRPYMDVIDNMLTEMFRRDPSFKPQGGRLGENDMDYDTDDKSMTTLRRHLRGARESYYRYKSEYMTYVSEALELEDTIKNFERGSLTGWKYISSIRPTQAGKLGSSLGTVGNNSEGRFIQIKENSEDKTSVEMEATLGFVTDDSKVGTSKPLKEEGRRYVTSKEAISNNYAAIREQSRQANARPVEKNIASAKESLPDVGNKTGGTSSGLALKWESMKNGFQNFKANIGNKKFLPLHQMQETGLVSRNSSTESLDEIFQRLKRPTTERGSLSDGEDDGTAKGYHVSGSAR